jgi:transcriptional regulator with XRE-family HTH domain
MGNIIQQLAKEINMSFDEFVGEMRKRGSSEPTAIKIWRGDYENYKNFNDNDMALSNLRKAADVFKVGIGRLFPKAFAEITRPGNLLVADQDYMLMKPNSVDHSNP